MADTQVITKQAAGLFSHPNPLTVPPGALLQAENAVFDREGVVGNRRGFNRYGTALSNAPSGMWEYLKKLIVKDGTTLKYDSDGAGTWSSWSGTFSPPANDIRIHSLEANGNFYFTTSNGVYKNDSLSGTPVRAGIPQALDLFLTAGSTGVTWFTADNQVGYRVLYGRIDANNNTLLGAPTIQFTITNASGSGLTEFVTIQALIPSGIVAGDFYEIYRTEMSGADSTPPGDRHFKVIRNKITSTDITNGAISYNDRLDPDFLGEELYTNPTQETISQENSRPPFAKYIAQYKGHVFFGGIKREQQIEIQLLDPASLTGGTSTLTLALGGTSRVYTFVAGGVSNLTNHEAGIWPSGTTAERVTMTMKALAAIINGDTGNPSPGNTLWDAYYTSGPDDAPGKVLIRARLPSTAAFTVVANSSGTGGAFSPDLTAAVTSTGDTRSHIVSRSKYQRPEAVPILNSMEIGRPNFAILGLATLKHALLVFKEDGIFSVTGETDAGGGFNFVVDEVDPTIRLVCPESLVTLDNAVFGYTTQGVIRAYEGGSGIVSRPVEISLNTISTFSGFSTITHAVAYEGDRKYLLFTQDISSDTTSRVGWVHNYLTNTWALWRKDISCGLVLSADQKLYLGHATDTYVLKERKSFASAGDDYMDEDIGVTVTAKTTSTYLGATVSFLTVTYSYTGATLSAGWWFTQAANTALVVEATLVSGTTYTIKLNVDINSALPTPSFSANLSIPIPLYLEWAPEDAGDAAVMKHFSWFQIYQENDFALNSDIGFYADTQASREFVTGYMMDRAAGWSAGRWGPSPTSGEQPGVSTPIRVPVPRNHQRCRALKVLYRHAQAKQAVNIINTALDVRTYGARTMKASS